MTIDIPKLKVRVRVLIVLDKKIIYVYYLGYLVICQRYFGHISLRFKINLVSYLGVVKIFIRNILADETESRKLL